MADEKLVADLISDAAVFGHKRAERLIGPLLSGNKPPLETYLEAVSALNHAEISLHMAASKLMGKPLRAVAELAMQQALAVAGYRIVSGANTVDEVIGLYPALEDARPALTAVARTVEDPESVARAAKILKDTLMALERSEMDSPDIEL